MYIGKAIWRIGHVAKLSGLSSRTIDYYTQHGLLEFERSSSNYRLYPESVLQTLERIKLLKKQRMSIAEIKDAIQTPNDDAIEPIIVEVQDEITCLQQKLTTLEEKMKDAPQAEKKLVYQKLEKNLTDVMKLLTLL
jgi:MerR family copper efflux transcriptional regulator